VANVSTEFNCMNKPRGTSAVTKGMWNLVLLVFHVGVLVATMLLHPPSLNHVDGALPKDISTAGREQWVTEHS
jgi:hypothetical protein